MVNGVCINHLVKLSRPRNVKAVKLHVDYVNMLADETSRKSRGNWTFAAARRGILDGEYKICGKPLIVVGRS